MVHGIRPFILERDCGQADDRYGIDREYSVACD